MADLLPLLGTLVLAYVLCVIQLFGVATATVLTAQTEGLLNNDVYNNFVVEEKEEKLDKKESGFIRKTVLTLLVR